MELCKFLIVMLVQSHLMCLNPRARRGRGQPVGISRALRWTLRRRGVADCHPRTRVGNRNSEATSHRALSGHVARRHFFGRHVQRASNVVCSQQAICFDCTQSRRTIRRQRRHASRLGRACDHTHWLVGGLCHEYRRRLHRIGLSFLARQTQQGCAGCGKLDGHDSHGQSVPALPEVFYL